MRVLKIKKRRGQYRTIYAPDKVEKKRLQTALRWIDAAQWRVCDYRIVHGFMRGKNPVTNAMAHIGKDITISMDLADFFDHVKFEHVEDTFRRRSEGELAFVKRYCFVDGAARQGLPTSPAMANIAFAKYDAEIMRRVRNIDPGAVYTRYADDLTFSFNRTISIIPFEMMIAQMIGPDFVLNSRKTSVQHARQGRRVITGVAVDEHGVHAPRKVRRKLRAALHQQNTSSAKGLQEWCSLKVPKVCRDVESHALRTPIGVEPVFS